jgi:hypothetical protein
MSNGRRRFGPKMIALMCFMLALYEAAAAPIMQPYTEEMDIAVFWRRATGEEILQVRAHIFSFGSMSMLALIVLTGRLRHLIPGSGI